MSRTNDEEARLLEGLKAIVTAFGTVLGRNIEIVLHDFRNPEKSVVAIANGHITGRTIGSPVLGGPQQDLGFTAVMNASSAEPGPGPVIKGSYTTLSAQGKALRSATVVFRNTDGEPFAGLCINADFNDLDSAHELIERLRPLAGQAETAVSEPADMELLSAEVIRNALSQTSGGRMNKAAKINAVRLMQEGGLFIIKGGVERAAEALGVTRFSIYNYLEELRNERA
ncbi:PAS domain-containing protein [Pseudomonas sp. SIMBA_059]|uniref:helix-turn-helix transcriptional regulator n=1 Tax=Pseudomonas palleroniana TaxID=191390 RepID=UPI0018E6D7BA|nr:PAS domain-containing protein [Pseudomonas palleroniana]MBI6906799.1 PAS domain-containing protein [Pseudomonas palleroniana]